MFGALIGDIVGSPYRKKGFKSMDFEFLDPQSLFTDDTVMTAATADAILNRSSFTDAYWNWGNRFPNAGYGKNFQKWLASSEKKPYFSYGNGSAMRVSPVGWAFETLEETMKAASDSASVTHDHPEGIKGAQSTASAIGWPVMESRKKRSKSISKAISDTICQGPLTKCAPTTYMTFRAWERCLPYFAHFTNRKITSMRSVW